MKRRLKKMFAWFRQRRRRRAAGRSTSPLREFVYLDEVSVFSLIASRLGPIASEFTDTQTSSLQADLTSQVGVTAGVIKSDVGSRVATTETKASQVMRKSTVQTTFRELHEYELDKFALKVVEGDLTPPHVKDVADLRQQFRAGKLGGWVIDDSILTRGRLIEVDCELDAERIFQVNAMVAAVVGLVGDDEALRRSFGDVQTAQVFNRVLGELLVGLVPVRGRSVDYLVLDTADKRWLVHRSLADQLPVSERSLFRDLHIVGVTEQSLYWKDIRRVLFSKSRYRILCRLAQSGVRSAWTPVKLVDVLGVVHPGLADQVRALAAISFEQPQTLDSTSEAMRLHTALENYASALWERDRGSLDDFDPGEIIGQVDVLQHTPTVEGTRERFSDVSRVLKERYSVETPVDVRTATRDNVLREAGVDLVQDAMSRPESAVPSARPAQDDRLLESEIVAIYW